MGAAYAGISQEVEILTDRAIKIDHKIFLIRERGFVIKSLSMKGDTLLLKNYYTLPKDGSKVIPLIKEEKTYSYINGEKLFYLKVEMGDK